MLAAGLADLPVDRPPRAGLLRVIAVDGVARQA